MSGAIKIIKKMFPSANERTLVKIYPFVTHINELESSIREESDDELRSRIPIFREKISKGMPLDDALPEVFAVVREASRRVLEMRHFDVQLVGGVVLHQGKIAEMKTGEGKTLVATLPTCLNALTGKGVHIVTVNDYLARRDSEWMGKIYRFLGLSVGVIQSDEHPQDHYDAYRCDITYGTNNEFGFDYLRDNMKISRTQFVQREHHYAIIDEVDSILVDEARTPLIISGPSDESTDLYVKIDRIIPKFRRDIDYVIDEKSQTASLSETGIAKAEKLLQVDNLYDPKHMALQHHINQALRAHTLFKRDVAYVVKDGQIMIVDEFTGRLMPGRRWSDGLHQAIEAKEGVKIASENQTLASITFQNYFRMYDKLAGMTGTAMTEAAEFAQIYDLDVVSIPTNKTLIRLEYPDIVMKTEKEKFKAVVSEIEELNKKGRPVLVGTIAIEKSEKLSKMLQRRNITHNVLNAKHHAREAEIVAQAGRKGAVTIATNMAGRGTDILLGGNSEFLVRQSLEKESIDEQSEEYQNMFKKMLEKQKMITNKEHQEVVELGGLHIIGTERHESRRIDNQLRGRSGRQGDPGSSRFYVSLEDDLMRIFGGERIKNLMDRLGMQEDEPIENKLVSRSIESAQKKVEAFNFSIRKNLLEYDDVMNKQREVVYGYRNEVLTSNDVSEMIMQMIEEVLDEIVNDYVVPKTHPDDWDMEGLSVALKNIFGFTLSLEHPQKDEIWSEEAFFEYLIEEYTTIYKKKREELDDELRIWFERTVLLQRIDANWKDHLLNMDQLREGIGLRGYGQRDPLKEYQREGFDLFQDMVSRIKRDAIRDLFIYQPIKQESIPAQSRSQRTVEGRGPMVGSRPARRGHQEQPEENQPSQPIETVRRTSKKVGRNDPCPCGSGKKYKKCCGV
ncbi:preprotein translocase subunit SecA [bacterium]|nr:preprotein translocase subunit SecA [candidate division CSSED10-310 bacterium]